MQSNLPDSRISIGEFEVIGFFESFEVESFSLTDSNLSGFVGLVDFERDRLSKRALFDFELEATELWRDEILFDFDVTVTSGSFRLLFFESISFLFFSLFRLFERLFSIFKSFSGFFDFLSEVFLFRFRFFFFLSSSSVSLELDDELEDELEIDFAFFFNFFFFSLSFAFNLCLEDQTSMSVITQIPFSIFSSSVAFLVLISSLIFVFSFPIRISSIFSRFFVFHVQVHRVVIRYPRILNSIHLIYPLIVLKIRLRMTHHHLLIHRHQHYQKFLPINLNRHKLGCHINCHRLLT